MPGLFKWAKFLNGEPEAPGSDDLEKGEAASNDSGQPVLLSPLSQPVTSDAEINSTSEVAEKTQRESAGIIPALHLPKLKLPKLPSNQRVVTFTAEKDVFRVVVFKSNRVVAWGSADPSALPQPEADPTDNESEEVIEETIRSPLQNLLAELNIGSGTWVGNALDKVGIRRGRTVMDLSLYTTLARHLQIPKVKGRYLEPVVVSEVLETLPFSKEEVDIAWQIQRESEDNSVFAVAMPKQRLDAQVMTAKEAGLAPEAAYSKSVALAAASGFSDGMVIHLERSEASLVLVQGGSPKAVHEVEFDTEDSDTEEQANVLARSFGQVASYYQTADPTSHDLELPVILTGINSDISAVTQPLIDKIQGRLAVIDSPVNYPQDFPIEEYAINLGLYLTDRENTGKGNERSIQTPSLNLLPSRHRPNPMPVFQAAVFVILALLVVHPFNVVGRVEAKIVEQQTATKELQRLRGQERQFNVVLANYQEHEAEMEDVSKQVSQLETQIEVLEGDLTTLLQRMQTITRTALEQDVELSAVVPQGDDLAIVGAAGSHAEALKYVLTIRNHPLFDDARVVQIDGVGGANPNDENVVNFQAKATKSIPAVEEESSEEQSEN